MSSDASRKTQANEEATSSEQRVSMDLALQNVLMNPDSRTENTILLVKSTVFQRLRSRLGSRVCHQEEDAKLLEKFLVKAGVGIDRLMKNVEKLYGEGDAIAAALSQEVQTFADALGKFSQPKEIASSSDIREAVQEAVDAVGILAKGFTAQTISDDNILPYLEAAEKVTPDLTVANFVDIPEKKAPELTFTPSESSAKLIDNLFGAHEGSVRSPEVSKEVPPFRWSWTDDELFLERKLPQVRRLDVVSSHFHEVFDNIAESLLAGFTSWKNEQLKLGVAAMMNPAQQVQNRVTVMRQSLENSELIFRKRVKEQIDFLKMVISLGILKENWWQHIASDMQKSLRSVFDSRMGAHSFIDTAILPLRDIFQHAKKCQYPLPSIRSAHTAPQNVIIVFQPGDKQVLQTAQLQVLEEVQRVTQERYSHIPQSGADHFRITNPLIEGCSALREETIHITMKRFLSGKFDSREKGSQKAAVKNAAARLLKELSSIDMSHLNRDSVTLVHIQEMKANLALILQCIQEFQDPEVPAHLLSIMKNAASYHVCWNVRNSILTAFLQENILIEGECLSEMEDFYPHPSLPGEPVDVEQAASFDATTESKPPLTTMFLRSLWTATQREVFTSLAVTGDDAKHLKLQETDLFSPQILAQFNAVLQAFGSKGMQTMEDAKRYIGSLQAIVDAIPACVSIAGNDVHMPSRCTEYLRTQIQNIEAHVQSYDLKREEVNVEKKVQTPSKMFVDPLKSIFEAARKLREARQKTSEEAQKHDEKPEPPPAPLTPNPVLEAMVVLDQSMDVANIHATLCSGISHSIATAAAVLVSNTSLVPSGMTPEKMSAFGEALHTVTSAVCTAFDAHLKRQSSDDVPTPEHVAAAVRAALVECDGVMQTLDENVRAKLRSDIEAIATETHEADEEGFLDLLFSGAIADVSGGEDSIVRSAIESAVRTIVQAQASRRITEEMATIRSLMEEARILLGDGKLLKALTDLERRHSEGDADALSKIITIVGVQKSSYTLATHKSPPPIK